MLAKTQVGMTRNGDSTATGGNIRPGSSQGFKSSAPQRNGVARGKREEPESNARGGQMQIAVNNFMANSHVQNEIGSNSVKNTAIGKPLVDDRCELLECTRC